MGRNARVLRSRWRWALGLTAAFFVWMAWITIESVPEMPNESDRSFFRVVGVVMLVGALGMLMTVWRKRVVLREDEMLVCWGVRTGRYRRIDILGARYEGARHEVAGYGLAYPAVKMADGREIRLKFLAERDGGGGLRRVENCIGDINDWAQAGRR